MKVHMPSFYHKMCHDTDFLFNYEIIVGIFKVGCKKNLKYYLS